MSRIESRFAWVSSGHALLTSRINIHQSIRRVTRYEVCLVRYSPVSVDLGSYSDGTSGAAYSVSMPLREWHSITLVFDGTNAKLYYDGVYKTQRSVLLSMLSTFKAIGIGTDPNTARSLQGSVKDVALYNRVLTDEEVMKLSNSKLHVDKGGNVLKSAKESTEKQYSRYFELGFDTKDSSRIVEASTKDNLRFENGSMWVGEATANEYAYPTFYTTSSSGGWSHWGYTGHQGSYGQNTDKRFIFDKTQKYSHWVANGAGATGNYLTYQSPAFEGGYRSLQAILCLEDFSEVNETKVYPAWNARNGGLEWHKWSSIERLGDSGFYLCKAEGISQDGSNDLVGIYVTAGVKMYLSQVQLEQKAFCTPFTMTSRGNGSVRWPLTLKDNMTFNFFRKSSMPQYLTVSQATSPNILEIGNYYSNASLTLWAWSNGSNIDVKSYIKGDTGSGWQNI